VAIPPKKRGPEQVRRRRRTLALLVALVAIAAVAIPLTRAVAKVTVPSVAKLSQLAAQNALRGAGLTGDIVLANSSTVATGRVITQKPPAGSSVRRGTHVTITVSVGPQYIAVPNVVGVSFDTARNTIQRAGFTVVRVNGFSDTIAIGKVVSQTPEANFQLARDGTVTLTVSQGAETVAVPNVVGKAQADATAALQAAGFNVTATSAYNDTVAAGLVVSQNPAGGAKGR
jgi:serine/threonine-protein kinase